jgi:DNA-binding transcriptional MocR family regulator
MQKKEHSMGFKYRELAEAYIADIRTGTLTDGQRLPSIRTLSAQHGVSVTTALKTYELLEAEGYLRAQPQSGFFVRRRAAAADSVLREPSLPDFSPRARSVDRATLIREIQHSANDTRRVPLGTVMLAPSLLPIAALQRSLVRSARRGVAHQRVPRSAITAPPAASRRCSTPCAATALTTASVSERTICRSPTAV